MQNSRVLELEERGAITMIQTEDYGFLTGFLRKVFFALDGIPSRLFLGRRSMLKLPRDPDELRRYAQKRAVKVDLYICSCVLIELMIVTSCGLWSGYWLPRLIVTLVCSVRIAEVFIINMNVAIFRADANPTVASVLRILVMTIVSYGELFLCFAGIYAAHSILLSTKCPWDAFYFSGTTQLTIGYGDILPTGWLRGVAVLQGWLGTMFALLIVGRLVGIMPKLQEIRVDGLSEDVRFEERI
jgi:hypothetical protein